MKTKEERLLNARWLRRRLRELGMTQQQAADKAHVTKRAMEYWLAGRVKIREPMLALFRESTENFAVTATR